MSSRGSTAGFLRVIPLVGLVITILTLFDEFTQFFVNFKKYFQKIMFSVLFFKTEHPNPQLEATLRRQEKEKKRKEKVQQERQERQRQTDR